MTLWKATLLAIFALGLIKAMTTGDVRWVALCVVPGWIFSKWWRI